ncbi:MAG: hypothetical protein IPG45_12850 [Deltaproteobacteria bacterium]|jgi:hypothetical protein|nr:hypothetical protein [Deltaproteobacteria bacterium]
MQVSGSGAAAGFIADILFQSFPIGTGVGAFAKNLFNLDAQDMNRAYDPKRATQGSETTLFGELKGMAQQLFGDLFGPPRSSNFSGGASGTVYPPGTPQEDIDRMEAAKRTAQPPTGAEVDRDAQIGSSPDWKKILLVGGAAIAGLTLVNRMFTRYPDQFGSFGMPFYPGGFPFML